MSWAVQKFDECRKCIYFVKNPPKTGAPVCRECDIGEFFEERMAELRPERLRLKGQEHKNIKTANEDENVSDE